MREKGLGRGDLRTLEHRPLLNSPDQHDAFTSLTIATAPKLPKIGTLVPICLFLNLCCADANTDHACRDSICCQEITWELSSPCLTEHMGTCTSLGDLRAPQLSSGMSHTQRAVPAPDLTRRCNNLPTLQIHNVHTLQIHSVPTSQIHNVPTLQIQGEHV